MAASKTTTDETPTVDGTPRHPFAVIGGRASRGQRIDGRPVVTAALALGLELVDRDVEDLTGELVERIAGELEGGTERAPAIYVRLTPAAAFQLASEIAEAALEAGARQVAEEEDGK